jgi:hypothetical protein
MPESYNRDRADKSAQALASSIAIISPISTTSWQQAFISGLGGANITLTWDDGHGYGTKKNYKALTKAIKSHDGQVGLIVTTGGNIAYKAAVDAGLTTPFMSLVGEVPARRPDNFFGGVALQSWLANDARISFMLGLGKGYHPSDVGLFCNRRSAMHGDETTIWHGSEYYLTGGGGNNNSAAFANEFNTVDDSIGALIISADPFFQDKKVDLINAANTWVGAKPGRSICYPLANYANVPGTTPMPPGTSYWFGPDLLKAYNLLGTVAVKAVTTGALVPFLYTTDASAGPL